MKNYTILIVDDEAAFLKRIVNIVDKSGKPYNILRTIYPAEALEIASTRLPDLIITDWEMPYMSGLELIEKLKMKTLTRQIPVIMCTGMMTSSKNLMAALEVGAVDFVRKPVDEVELLARIRSMLELMESHKIIQNQKEELHSKENELLISNLAIKDKELTVNTLNNIRNQELLKSIGEDLQKILEISDNETIEEHIQSVIKKLNISSKQSVWEEFRKYFENVHSSFFKNLQAHCPLLSQNELKLCAFIKLNFSSKDISAITGQIPHSIDVARYRIRKKLKLQHKETLFIFLSEL